MLKKEQKKWIEDNYDLVRKAVKTYSTNEMDCETVESWASLVVCECLAEGIDSTNDLRTLIEKVFKIVIPVALKYEDYAHEYKTNMEVPLPNYILDDIGKYYLWGKHRCERDWGYDIITDDE